MQEEPDKIIIATDKQKTFFIVSILVNLMGEKTDSLIVELMSMLTQRNEVSSIGGTQRAAHPTTKVIKVRVS